MSETDLQKNHAVREIIRARGELSADIQQLGDKLRRTQRQAPRDHAPKLVAGAAVAGILAGFAAPEVLKKALKWGGPIALAAVAVKLRKQQA